jgi:hypothetical protein
VPKPTTSFIQGTITFVEPLVLSLNEPLTKLELSAWIKVDCGVLDGSRVMGADVVEFEVLFGGRFSDVGLPASLPA